MYKQHRNRLHTVGKRPNYFNNGGLTIPSVDWNAAAASLNPQLEDNITSYKNIVSNANKTTGGIGLLGTKFGQGPSWMGAAGNAVGSMIGSGISGGLESGVGNAIGQLGNIASNIPGPWGAAISGGLQVVGGLTNAMFGSKLNQENINKINDTVGQLNAVQADASDYDTLSENMASGPTAFNFNKKFVGKDGLFSNKAKKEYKKLKAKMELAEDRQALSYATNADNIAQNTMANLERNYIAEGGSLTTGGKKKKKDQESFIKYLQQIAANSYSELNQADAESAMEYLYKNQNFLNYYSQTPEDQLAMYVKDIPAEYNVYDGGGFLNFYQLGGDKKEKNRYIGGKNNIEARSKFFDTYPEIAEMATKSAYKFGVDPRSVIGILAAEGFVDQGIRYHNSHYRGDETYLDSLNRTGVDLESSLGNDYAKEYIDKLDNYPQLKEKLNVTPEYRNSIQKHTNKKVVTGSVPTVQDAFDVIAANLAVRKEELKAKYGDRISDDDLEYRTRVAYNMGNNHRDLLHSTKYKDEWDTYQVPEIQESSEIDTDLTPVLITEDDDFGRHGRVVYKNKNGDIIDPYGIEAIQSEKENIGSYNHWWQKLMPQVSPSTFTPIENLLPISAYTPSVSPSTFAPNITPSSVPSLNNYIPTESPSAWVPAYPYAFGGELNTNGADFTNGLLSIDAGKSHEENPFQGVPMGTDAEGTPNLVEEGETIYNDYVFSKRLKVPDELKERYGLAKKKEYSFAEASKRFAKESEERPNDPISKRGLDAMLGELTAAQEYVKEEQRRAEEQKQLLEQRQMSYGGRLYDGYDSSWLEHAPLYGMGLATLTDALGITNKKDYTNATTMETAARNMSGYRNVSYNPSGNHARYTPLDTRYGLNQLVANQNATRRALLSNAGMNRGAGMAAILAADHNANTSYGNMYRQALESNIAQRQQVLGINNQLDLANAQAAMQAAQANQSADQTAKERTLKGIQTAARLRENISRYADQNKSSNYTNFLTGLGDYGKYQQSKKWANDYMKGMQKLWEAQQKSMEAQTKYYGAMAAKWTSSEGGE